jgi:hypothetical protein
MPEDTNEEMQVEEEKKGFRFPTAYTVLFLLLILFVIVRPGNRVHAHHGAPGRYGRGRSQSHIHRLPVGQRPAEHRQPGICGRHERAGLGPRAL